MIFKPGLNLLVGRNGSGKSNLIALLHHIATDNGDLKGKIESSFFAKQLSGTLRHKGKAIEQKFGQPTIAKYSFRNNSGNLKLFLKNTPEQYVAKNILRDLSGFHGHIGLKNTSVPINYKQVYGNLNAPKFEMSGFISTNVLAKQHDNQIHEVMSGPIREVSDFIRSKMIEFYQSSDFLNKITHLENEINGRFSKFLGTTSKEVKINCNDINVSGRVSLSLMDNGNYIQSADVSSGEAILLNLVFSLAVAKDIGCDVLTFDEPDIHMHDDMISVLVEELTQLSQSMPNCIIVIASHSTALIEKLAALGSNQLNVITFDKSRNVSNSKKDVELINALTRNGVKFSPLMISRKRNLFIENQFKSRDASNQIFSKFFNQEEMPNIIPIGNSGNVQDSNSFRGIFEDILKMGNLRSVGIQDGDIWFKPRLREYMMGQMVLTDFIATLKKLKGCYIKGDAPHLCYFNFWEIENLFLIEEILTCWKSKDGSILTSQRYSELIEKNIKLICDEYSKMFYKSILRFPVDKAKPSLKMRDYLSVKFNKTLSILGEGEEVDHRVKQLFRSLLDNNLLNWIPGKELKGVLENNGYTFIDSDFEYLKTITSKRIQKLPE